VDDSIWQKTNDIFDGKVAPKAALQKIQDFVTPLVQ